MFSHHFDVIFGVLTVLGEEVHAPGILNTKFIIFNTKSII